MKQRLIIQGRLPGMNEITAKNRGKAGWKSGSSQKKQYTKLVAWCCKLQNLKPYKQMIDITFTWYCCNKRRDKDNIMVAQKFVFDGLQEAGIIVNDGWDEIGNIEHRFIYNKELGGPDDEFVVVDMEESKEWSL